MTEVSIDTKEKIMEVARILFANQGFEGTSIREIAKAADVNIASVNYYFSNKENLFTAILQMGHLKCAKELRGLYEKGRPNLDDLLVSYFNYFLEESHDLVSFFKMMMSTQHAHHLAPQGAEDEFIGPPGGQVIMEAILKEVGTKVPEADLHWAIKALFSHVVHMSLMYNCCFQKNKNIPFTSHEDIEKSIRRLTRVVLKDLKASNS